MKYFQLAVLFIIMATSYAQNTDRTQYFRHLRYNHVSPYLDLNGTYPINKETAETTSHYIFKYDDSGRIIEIINNHYHTERQHPLASLGVYRVEISYPKDKEIRVFYDKNGKRITNDREIFKEVYTFNKRGFKSKLQFYDEKDLPMESNWGISEYQWSKNKKLIIEKRYNLKKEAVALSPYFQFGTTGILLDKNGFPLAHYNLDDNLKVIANDKGTASYKDIYDTNGNHATYSYYDENDNLVTNQWGFAYGEKKYDSIGNYIGLDQFDVDKKRIRTSEIPSNAKITLAAIASKKDSTEIKRLSLGYLVALQDLKPNLMNEVLNDSLNKVTIGWDRTTKKEYARATTKAQMIEYAATWNKSNTKFPFNPSNTITILDIYNRIATVKLVSDNWVEYLHLIKQDGTWSIVNLLWQYKDVNRYPKS
ncbi:nuclear transport factor 2 family protein [Mangrovimonas yunxiaonensis]|uniref:nuclear transport factor 2 family protein n=1 Tax=Mangrovimonas yunxiaonensis TaxID=1197477 RepID=UPI000A0635DD|nr:nuclear transport factor 2 family protein [Mangrovimonas yunxiaonensis]GGH38782.1 hypothetical protein GCM10011364_07800 [Mangrovimonas yunxiaonensis]